MPVRTSFPDAVSEIKSSFNFFSEINGRRLVPVYKKYPQAERLPFSLKSCWMDSAARASMTWDWI